MEDTLERYSYWCRAERKCIEEYENGIISLQQRAEKLTELFYWFCNKKLEPPEVFTLDDVYNEDINKFLVIKLIIEYDRLDERSLNYLFAPVRQYIMRKVNYRDKTFLQFRFVIPKSKLFEEIEKLKIEDYYRAFDPEERKQFLSFELSRSYGSYKDDLYELYNPETSYYHSMNIPHFLFTIGLTPLKELFWINGSPSLKYPFHRFKHAIYLALNNGSMFYKAGGGGMEYDRPTRPKYYPEFNETFRSSWEANIAKILNYKGIAWVYEGESFLLDSDYLIQKYKCNVYYPDFIINNNCFIEVKGFWDDYSIRKVQLFKEQYPQYKLFIIDRDMMYSLNKIYEKIIINWEPVTYSINEEILPVVGINIEDRINYVQNLNIGDEVFLERDHKNPYDKNAIRVLDKNGNMLGHIAKEWASIYSEKLDLGMKFEATVQKKEKKVIRIKVKRSNLDDIIIYDFLQP